MKLFTIGDSISQGFMSCADARPELAYSSILARTHPITLMSEIYEHEKLLQLVVDMINLFKDRAAGAGGRPPGAESLALRGCRLGGARARSR